MNFLAFFEKNDIIHGFFSKFQNTKAKKLTKYLLIISIDYLYKYFRNQPIKLENIRDLTKIVKSKRKAQTTSTTKALTSELSDIKIQISKLKLFCSTDSRTPKSNSNRKNLSPKEKKSLTLEELNYNSIKKTAKTPKEITPKITETKPPRSISAHSVGNKKPTITKHHLDDNEIKASLLEISSNLFSSCSHKTKQIECPNKNYSSVKNINSSNRLLAPKKLEIKDKKHGITVMEKSLKLPSYLRSVKSKIKPEIEFHKKMFKASQLSPDFQMKEDLKFEDDKIINEFITFGSSQNPSPITNRRNQSYENLKNESKGNYNNDNLLNCKKNRNNNDYIQRNKENFNNNQNFSNNSNSNISNNIVEIANSFLKSPFMQFIQGNHKNEEISQINALESSRHKSSRCLRNSDYGFNDITQKFLNSNKESHFIKKESSSYSNLIKVDQISDDESISSTFSMLPTNEELQGFFRKEFCLNMGNFAKNCQNVNNYQNFNNSENNFKNLNNLEKEINEKSVRRDRESDIGKIISVSSRRDKENSDK